MSAETLFTFPLASLFPLKEYENGVQCGVVQQIPLSKTVEYVAIVFCCSWMSDASKQEVQNVIQTLYGADEIKVLLVLVSMDRVIYKFI